MTKKVSTPSKGGRPRKPLDLDKIKNDLAEGGTKEEVYKNQNLTPAHATVREKKDPELAKAIQEGQEEFRQKFANNIKPLLVSAYKQKVLEGDVAAILFGMRNIVGFHEKKGLEVSGEVQHIHSLTPEDRAKRIAELRKELESAVDVEIEPEVKDDSQ